MAIGWVPIGSRLPVAFWMVDGDWVYDSRARS